MYRNIKSYREKKFLDLCKYFILSGFFLVAFSCCKEESDNKQLNNICSAKKLSDTDREKSFMALYPVVKIDSSGGLLFKGVSVSIKDLGDVVTQEITLNFEKLNRDFGYNCVFIEADDMTPYKYVKEVEQVVSDNGGRIAYKTLSGISNSVTNQPASGSNRK